MPFHIRFSDLEEMEKPRPVYFNWKKAKNKLLCDILNSCRPWQMCGPDRKKKQTDTGSRPESMLMIPLRGWSSMLTFEGMSVNRLCAAEQVSVVVHVRTCGKGSAEASRTFSGFRSQWTMFLKCRCLRATRICPQKHTNRKSLKICFERRLVTCGKRISWWNVHATSSPPV